MLDLNHQDAETALTVLVLAPRAQDQVLVGSLAQRDSLKVASCESFDELLQQTSEDCGLIVLDPQHLGDADFSRLCRALGDQPTWSEIPVIVFRSAEDDEHKELESLLSRSGVRWLTRPILMDSLAGLATTCVEARRRQIQVAGLLRDQAQLNEELQERSHQLSKLTVELIEAEDRERQRIARLLHDDLQQMLVGACLRLEAAMKKIDATSDLVAPLACVRDLILKSQRRCRRLSHDLFPVTLNDADVTVVLDYVAEQARSNYGLSVNLTTGPHLGQVSPVVLRFIYRAVREILLNAAKYAGVDSVHIAAERCGDRLDLELNDKGVGFDPDRINRDGESFGIGLLTIRERADALGGTLSINSQPGAGSRLHLSIPAEVSSMPQSLTRGNSS